MKAITVIIFAIAACAGMNAAMANEERTTEIVTVTTERIDPAATGDASQRIELASGSRDVSKS